MPPVFTGDATTEMNCVRTCMTTLHERAYNHHIQRLMVLGNLAMLHGVDPWAMTEWMWSSFVDGAEWVMLPERDRHEPVGRRRQDGDEAVRRRRQLHRQDERLLRDCRFDRKQRVGDDACPFTTLYWDFLARHHDLLVKNPRIARQVRASEQLSDLPAVRERAVEVRRRLDDGTL